MATKQSSSRRGNRTKQGSNGRSASQKPEQYRFAQNVDGEGTVAEQEYRSYVAQAREELPEGPDVLLDVPVVKVDSIHLEVEDLDAHVALKAKVLDLLELDAGIEAHLGKLTIDIKGVEAQALLKVRLDHVAAIVDRVMTTLDRNPELIESLGRAVEDVGQGAEGVLDDTGKAAESVGEGAEGALQDVGEGAGQAVGEIGQGASQAAGQLGEGAGQAAGEVGQGAGEAVGNLDQTVGNLGETVGQAAGGLGEAGDLTAPKLAKAAAKTVAKEIGAAASDEAKDLGLAATRKVKALGERRRQKRAERQNATPDATPAALRAAEELDVDLEEVEGTGSEGRITVGDVRDAAEEG